MRVLAACLALFAVVFVVATVALVGPRGGSTQRVGPDVHYLGLVNGKHAGAVIYVVCPGPAGGNRTGPPAGNQTVKVVPVTSGGGYTGSIAHQIWAEFNKGAAHFVGFTQYKVAQAFPTALRLPCQGTGTVTFTTCFGTLCRTRQ
jgi:hypothetical protein